MLDVKKKKCIKRQWLFLGYLPFEGRDTNGTFSAMWLRPRDTLGMEVAPRVQQEHKEVGSLTARVEAHGGEQDVSVGFGESGVGRECVPAHIVSAGSSGRRG